jgi:hypothetical protein
MRLTQKLFSFLHGVFDKDPAQFLALRIQYAGAMTWEVSDATLTTTVTGGPGRGLTIDLTQYTIGQLANFIGVQPGYSIAYVDQSTLSLLSARVLIDASNDISLSNGDHLYGYTSELWSYMEAQASELEQAETQIANMLEQMSTPTAQGEWLDFLGAYYGVPRSQGELDPSYSARIIAEVLRPRSNNVALEMAISAYTGESTTVTDVIEYGPTFPLYNGAIVRNGTHFYNASAKPIYGLFDVQYAYDLLNGSDETAFAQTVIGIVNRYRAAGTHMRQLALLLAGSGLLDALTPPSDGGSLTFAVSAPLSDSLTAPSDALPVIPIAMTGFSDALNAPLDGAAISVTTQYRYNSVRHYNGQIYRLGNSVWVEDLGSSGDVPFTMIMTANGASNADGSQTAIGLL